MIVNLTNRPLTLLEKEDPGRVLFHRDRPWRSAFLRTTRTPLPPLRLDDGVVPIMKATYSGVVNLPPPAEGVVYVVPTLLSYALCDVRDDLVSPYGLIKDEDGLALGCWGLQKVSGLK